MKKLPIWLVTIILLFLIAIPLGIYVYNFRGFLLSGSSSDWGTFGDFIGGILNPIFAACSLILLIYISYELNEIEERRSLNNIKIEEERQRINIEIEDKRNDHNNEFQKKLVLSDLRQAALKEFMHNRGRFYSIIAAKDFKENGIKQLTLFNLEIGDLIREYAFLFPSIDSNKSKTEIGDSLKSARDLLKIDTSKLKMNNADPEEARKERIKQQKNFRIAINKSGNAISDYITKIREEVKNGWS